MAADENELTDRDGKGRFVKGVSGNPAGRPKTSVAALWRRLNAEVDPDDTAGRTRAEVLYERLYKLSEKDPRAVALIVERTDGKARQSISLDVDDGWRERKVQSTILELERDGQSLSRAEVVAWLADEDSRFEDYE
ncbi:MAG: DUF5681 domain-containing protein [Pyrinomonadaceae bacterium]